MLEKPDRRSREIPETLPGVPADFKLPIDPISATRLVTAIQDAVDTSQCRVLATNVWIIIRNEIYYSIAKEVGRFFDAVIGKPSYLGRVYSGQPLPRPQKFQVVDGSRSSLISANPAPLATLKGGTVFCEVPGDYTQFIDGLAVNCFADPIITLMRDHVARTGPLIKLCRLQPRMASVAKLVDPYYFFHNSAAELSGKTDALRHLRETIFAVNRYLYDHQIPFTLNVASIEQQVRDIISYRNAFVDIFDELEPHQVFVQNFGNTEKFGALFAARELQIPTVDIQHGIQENTSMYNWHPGHCNDGSYLYPDTLWCWGEITANALRQEQAQRPVPWKDAIVGGYPWKSLILEQSSNIRINKLRELLPKGKRIALYCHDPALINSQSVIGLLPGEIFHAIRNSEKDVFWLLRLHPRAVHLLKEFGDFCESHGFTNVEFEYSSTMPAEQIMQVADVLLTKFSVCALEAMSIGLPVISHSWIGEVTFETYKAHPLLSFAYEPAEIVAAILKAQKTTAPFPYVDTDAELSAQVFRSLCAETKAPASRARATAA